MSMELRREAARRERERERLAAREEELGGDVRRIASLPEGKRFLRRLLAEGDIYNPAYVPGVAGAYMAGKRAQALELFRLLGRHLPEAERLSLAAPEPDDGADDPGDGDWPPE